MSDNPYKRPGKFAYEEGGGGITLTRRWFSIPRLVLPLFVIVLLFVEDDHPFDFWPILLLMAYFLSMFLLNKTRIIIDPAHIRMTHGPVFFPFRRNRKWLMNNIEKISVIPVARIKRDAATGMQKRAGYSYVVRLRTLSGKDFEIHSFRGEDDARYLKREMMRHVAPRLS